MKFLFNEDEAEALYWLFMTRHRHGNGDFDYPFYAGLPAKLSRPLGSDFIDLVQSQWPLSGYRTFSSMINDFNGTVGDWKKPKRKKSK